MQTYAAGAIDPEDRVLVETATLTDESGNYMLFVKPGDYNLVCYKEGRTPETARATTSPGATVDMDFALEEADTGTLTGGVTIDSADPEQYATISIRLLRTGLIWSPYRPLQSGARAAAAGSPTTN